MQLPPDMLELPATLTGQWQHALIVTYGIDVPFFENVLLRQFSGTCSNKIILADGDHYEDASQSLARSGLARHLNHHYVAGGVFANLAAHAKMILLVSSERGRLLVGSGNLGMQGFASGGELFVQYEFDASQPVSDQNDSRPFVTATHFVRRLIEGGFVPSRQVARQFGELCDNCLWMLRTQGSNEASQLRHNLDRPFVEQLQDLVAGERVEEMWVLSPFYDREAKALERHVLEFDPIHVTLMVQKTLTSLDPAAVQHVFSRNRSRLRVLTCSRSSDSQSPYIHAKMILLRTATRDICLQGSPNMSQAAMTLVPPVGNIELANLLELPRGSLDTVLRGLVCAEFEGDLADLNIAYHEDDPEATPFDSTKASATRIVDAEWEGDHLVFVVRGDMQSSGLLALIIGDTTFEAPVFHLSPGEIDITLTPAMREALGSVKPAWLRFATSEAVLTLGPIFPVNRATLETTLRSSGDHQTLGRIGALDLADDEIERLLGELEASLVIDERSLWQVARSTGSVHAPEYTMDEPRLRLADIDWDELRQHPRLRQYVLAGSGLTSERPSRLQLILAAILGQVQAMVNTDNLIQTLDITTGEHNSEAEQAESEAEREEDAVARQPISRSVQPRIRDTLVRFIKRYLDGVETPSFQRAAGATVLTKNYIIFGHLLWRLMGKDWVEPEFLIEATLRNWCWFWGEADKPGWYLGLDGEDRTKVDDTLREYGSLTLVLIAAIAAARFCQDHLAYRDRQALEGGYRTRWEGQMLAVRDSARYLVPRLPIRMDQDAMVHVWRELDLFMPYVEIRPTHLSRFLAVVLDFQTEVSLLASIERHFGLATGSCRFSRQKVSIPGRGEIDVMCMDVPGENSLADFEAALFALSEWRRALNRDGHSHNLRAAAGGNGRRARLGAAAGVPALSKLMTEANRDYYRLQNFDPNHPGHTRRTISYDSKRDEGKFIVWKDGGPVVRSFNGTALPDRPWDERIEGMAAVACKVDTLHTLLAMDDVPSHSLPSVGYTSG